MTHNRNKRVTIWTLVITSVALFMVSLDNLVVTTALPVIRRDLHATISQLEWTVNAYTLTFAVLLLTGAALGDRFGRRRLFTFGLLLFTGASAFAALSTSANALDIARAVQGVGGAIIAPLTLTILSAAVAPERRGLALGIWGGVGGLAIAIGPLVGGAIVGGVSWHWIFWLNVPIGLVLAPLAWRQLEETYGPDKGLDLPGLGLASAALLGIVWGLVRGNDHGWTSVGIDPRCSVRRVGAAYRIADAANAVLPQPHVRAHEHCVALHVLRNVRIDLLARAVLPDRAALLPAAVWPPDPAVDGHADLHRSDRGCALRSHRWATSHGCGPCVAVRRAHLDRCGELSYNTVRRSGRAVRALRLRDVAVLRPGGERCAQFRTA